ncbi:MAG: metal-dependent hydrolase [Candidatus Diapherotrites archaeon]
MEALLHYVLPVLLLLAIFPEEKRNIFLLSFLAVLPDLDWITGHRTLFHNVFAAAAVVLLAYFLSKKNRKLAFFAGFLFASHLILDLSHPGIPLLWPLSNYSFALNFGVYINSITSAISFSAWPLIEVWQKQIVSNNSTILSEAGFTLLILLAVAVAIFFKHSRGKKSL